jgi:hypothetical protein
MYGIPADLNLSKLIGIQIKGINVVEFMTVIQFEDGTTICIEGEAKITKNDVVITQWKQESGWNTNQYALMIGKLVSSYEVITPRELVINLMEGLQIHIFDNSNEYESFHIYPEGIHI